MNFSKRSDITYLTACIFLSIGSGITEYWHAEIRRTFFTDLEYRSYLLPWMSRSR